MIFYFMVLLYLSLTSLVTCSQDTCPVVSYIGRRDNINNQVKGSAILGYSYKNITADTIHKCFSACVQDCRCVSCQHSGTRCELVDENRHTAPGSFKVVPGYVYVELEQKFRNKRSRSCSSRCFNGCCRSPLCQNGGTCIELCDNVTRKFECKCRNGYGGRVCEIPPNCSGYKYETSPGLYPIMVSNGKKVNLFCDMTSESGMVWTLIESFALSNKDKYRSKSFAEDFPVNEDNFNWTDYRLSLPVMQHIQSHSTHWRATCNYGNDGLVKTDYMKGQRSIIDVTTYFGNSFCFRVDYINVRGNSCSNCTTHLSQAIDKHIFIGSYKGLLLNCDINFFNGSGSQSFGNYRLVDRAHRCSSSSSSTTQWWLGSSV